MEGEVKNLSKQFKPSSTFSALDKLEENEKDTAKLFQLSDFLHGSSQENRNFIFDSETARNFDQENINKAKQGVKELMADAIAKAKKNAIDIKEQALKEGKDTGYKDGYQEGFEKGKTTAKEDYGPLLETLNNLILDLSEFRKMMYPKVEKEMVGTIVDLTKKVLRHEMNLREDIVKEMILLAMDSVVNKENMTIHVHPDDKKYAEEFSPELKNLFGEIKNISFETNSGVERGGCVVKTNFGTIAAGIDQLEEKIDKILQFTPAIPEVNVTSKNLPEKKSASESDLEVSENTTGTEKTSMSQSDEALEGETGSTHESKTEVNEEHIPSIDPEEKSEEQPGSMED